MNDRSGRNDRMERGPGERSCYAAPIRVPWGGDVAQWTPRRTSELRKATTRSAGRQCGVNRTGRNIGGRCMQRPYKSNVAGWQNVAKHYPTTWQSAQ